MTFPDSSKRYLDPLNVIFLTSAPTNTRFHVARMTQPYNLRVTIPSELFYNSAFITNEATLDHCDGGFYDFSTVKANSTASGELCLFLLKTRTAEGIEESRRRSERYLTPLALKVGSPNVLTQVGTLKKAEKLKAGC